jgi:hypothetical protein
VTARRLTVVAGLLAASLAFGWGLMSALAWFLRTPAPVDDVAVADTPPPPPPAPPAVPKIKATLFFVSEDGRMLEPVEVEVPLAQGTVAQARALVSELCAAHAPEPLASAIPTGTTLRGLFVSQRNEAFVDLEPTIREQHPGGSMHELLTVYSLVNTLLVNVPALESVQILIGGREADTLAGHVDLRRPLRKNDSLIHAPTVRPQP